VGLWLTRKKAKRPVPAWAWRLAIWAWPASLFAILVGWIFTEMGRQPFVVVPNPDLPVGRQIWFFTAQAVSPGVTAAEVWTSLITLTVVYGALAVVELGLIGRFVRAGVTTGDGHPTPGFSPDPPDDEDDDAPRRDRDDDVLQFAY
jgi:cytochrome d ubiquinol oxidase subunit I